MQYWDLDLGGASLVSMKCHWVDHPNKYKTDYITWMNFNPKWFFFLSISVLRYRLHCMDPSIRRPELLWELWTCSLSKQMSSLCSHSARIVSTLTWNTLLRLCFLYTVSHIPGPRRFVQCTEGRAIYRQGLHFVQLCHPQQWKEYIPTCQVLSSWACRPVWMNGL